MRYYIIIFYIVVSQALSGTLFANTSYFNGDTVTVEKFVAIGLFPDSSQSMVIEYVFFTSDTFYVKKHIEDINFASHYDIVDFDSIMGFIDITDELILKNNDYKDLYSINSNLNAKVFKFKCKIKALISNDVYNEGESLTLMSSNNTKIDIMKSINLNNIDVILNILKSRFGPQ